LEGGCFESFWGVSVEPIFAFFSLFLFHEGGMVGKRAVTFWVNIKFIAARLPTLQIWGEKKSSKSLKRHTPVSTR